MINSKRTGILLLQTLIVLLAFSVFPAAANPPVVLEGDLFVGGQPAPVGTEVKIVADGKTIGSTVVSNAGHFGDQRSNRLGIPSGHNIVAVYVNGVEALKLDLNTYKTGDTVSLKIDAPAVNSNTDTPKPGGGFGGGGGYSDIENKEDNSSVTTDISSAALQSTADIDENANEEKQLPVDEAAASHSNSPIFVLLAVIIIVAGVGFYRYGYKKQ